MSQVANRVLFLSTDAAIADRWWADLPDADKVGPRPTCVGRVTHDLDCSLLVIDDETIRDAGVQIHSVNDAHPTIAQIAIVDSIDRGDAYLSKGVDGYVLRDSMTPTTLHQAITTAVATRQVKADLDKVRRELAELQGTDPSSGLYNRDRFDHVLRDEWARARRGRSPLSLIRCEVDYFEQYRSLYGEEQAFDCLNTIGRTITGRCKRAGDLAAKYDDSSFAVILPGAESDHARTLAELLCVTVSGLRIIHEGSPDNIVTASLGVVTLYPGPDSISIHVLTERADDALAQARDTGCNRVAEFIVDDMD